MEKMDQRDHPPPYDARPANPGGQPYPGYPPPGQPIHVSVAPPPNAVIVTQPTIIHVGRCPACQIGVLTDHFTCLGIFCAIFFFPLGVLCCFMMTEKRCSNCRAHFG